MRPCLILAVAAVASLLSTPPPVAASSATVHASTSPYSRPLSVSAHGLAWSGAYPAAGVGTRVGWEILPDRLGIDLFLDHLFASTDGRARHDHNLGFDAWFPVRVSPRVRLRPMVGACAVISLIEDTARRSDDILLGFHGGLGADYALRPRLSAYVDLQAFAYVGHEGAFGRTAAGLGDDLALYALGQLSAGLRVHMGPWW